MASGIAELLALEGRDVEFVTGYGMVAPFADETLEAYLVIQRLHELGVAIRRGTSLVGVGDRALEVEDEFGNPHELSSAGVVLVTQRVSRDALFHELDGVREGLYRIGDCVAPRLLAEAIFDGHRLAREIDSPDPEIALPYLRERPLDDPVEHPPPGRLLELPLPPVPRSRDLELLDTDAPVRIGELLAGAAPDVVVCAGRGAGEDLGPYRALAERLGGRFVVSRPQVEAGRAGRRDLVGVSSNSVAPAVYLAFGVSGALPHLLGMRDSTTVVAVNSDPDARIFRHADYGAVADAGDVVRALLVG
jgi:hypothetical protein